MAEENLKAWVKIELVFEGGRVDDPKDPGGRTAFGVTQRVYNGYRKARKLPVRDVFLIDAREVVDIFKTGYWDKVWGDRLPAGLDIVVADGAINSGVAQSVKWLQRALGTVRVDGIMGDAVLKACDETENIDGLIAAYIERREAFLKALKTFKRFGKGWMRRTTQLEKIGQEIGRGNVGPAPVKVADMGRKARIEDAVKGPPPADGVWSAGTTTGVVAQATAALEPFQNIEKIAHLLTIFTVIGVVVGVLGGLYSWYARNKRAAINDALDVRPAMPVNDNEEPMPEGMDDVVDEVA